MVFLFWRKIFQEKEGRLVMKKLLGMMLVLTGCAMFFISPALAANLDLSMVQPGDILLGRNPNSLRAQSGYSYYTHAALAVSKNMTIEVLGFGSQVQGYPISNWVKDFQDGDWSVVAILRVKTTTSLRNAAVKKAYGEYGKYYYFFPGTSYNSVSEPYFHACSTLIWYAYMWGAGINLDYNNGGWIQPDDIALDDNVQYLRVQSQ